MRDFFKTVFSMVYKIFNFFNLVPALFVFLLGAVLYFTGVFATYPVILYLFEGCLIFALIYAIVATIRKLLGIDKKVKKSKGAQIISGGTSEGEKSRQEPEPTNQPNEKYVQKVPRYFRVKENPDYLMAEYDDRYELYLIKDGNLRKIRTDYK